MSNAYERVAAAIRQDILGGKLPSGQRLPDEASLARRYEVGRSTVRESLRLLTGRGWVRTVRGTNGGVFITQPDPVELGDDLGDDLTFLVGGQALAFSEILEARHLQEEASVRLAARRAGPAEHQRLHQLADAAEQLLDDPEAFNTANVEFHIALTQAAHNRVLMVWIGAMHRVLSDVMLRATAARDARLTVAREHREIAEAVASGDPDAAAAAMDQHLRDFEKAYLTSPVAGAR